MDLHDLALRLVLDWLPLRDVRICGQVCRRWRTVAKDPDFWRDKRLKLLQGSDRLAVLHFAPCLGELDTGNWSDAKFDRIAAAVRESGVEIAKLRIRNAELDLYDVHGLLEAVPAAHIVELYMVHVSLRSLEAIMRMSNLRVLKVSTINHPQVQASSNSLASSVEVLHDPIEIRCLPFISQHAAIQELYLGSVSWSQLDSIVRMPQLRQLYVGLVLIDDVGPSHLPTPACHLQTLAIGEMLRDRIVSAHEERMEALIRFVSATVQELSMSNLTVALFKVVAAMPALRRLNVVVDEDWDPSTPIISSPAAPVETVVIRAVGMSNGSFTRVILRTFAATLRKVKLSAIDDLFVIAELPMSCSLHLLGPLRLLPYEGLPSGLFERDERGIVPPSLASLPRPPGNLPLEYFPRIDCIHMDSLDCNSRLFFLPLAMPTLRELRISVRRYGAQEKDCLWSFLSDVYKASPGKLQRVVLIVLRTLFEEVKGDAWSFLLKIRKDYPSVTLSVVPFSERHALRMFGNGQFVDWNP